jgi:hypothetical protein
MIMTNKEMFLKAAHLPTGVELFVFLTNDQLYCDDDAYTVVAFEEINGGEMVMRDVMLSDLEILEEA